MKIIIRGAAAQGHAARFIRVQAGRICAGLQARARIRQGSTHLAAARSALTAAIPPADNSLIDAKK